MTDTGGPRRHRIVDALDERLGIRSFGYPVPEHADSVVASLGALTAACLLVVVVTGICLAQWYTPTPAAANASVRHIVAGVWAGQFIRSVHVWAAQATYVLALLHLLRVFVTGSYKRPREATWLAGVVLLALIVSAVFTGTTLAWDQQAFEVVGHAPRYVRIFGGIGFWGSSRLAGNVSIVVRLYVAHVAIVPVLLLLVSGVHGRLVRRHGISPHAARGDRADGPLVPFSRHLRRIGAALLVMLGTLSALALLWPRGVGPTPVEGIEVTKPPWMFWWLWPLERWFGPNAIVWAPVAVLGLLAALPFVDRSPRRHWRERRVALVVGGVVVAILVALTIVTAATTTASHLT